MNRTIYHWFTKGHITPTMNGVIDLAHEMGLFTDLIKCPGETKLRVSVPEYRLVQFEEIRFAHNLETMRVVPDSTLQAAYLTFRLRNGGCDPIDETPPEQWEFGLAEPEIEEATYAVTVTLCVGLAGDPLPTDPNDIVRNLAENFRASVIERNADDLVECIVRVEPVLGKTLPQDVLPRSIGFGLPRENGDEEGVVEGHIEFGPTGIEIYLDGYGMKCMSPGHGGIVYLNHFGGSPQLVVHGDILQEDPSQVIQLATAAESRRDDVDAREPLHSTEANPNLVGNRREVIYTFGPHTEASGDLTAWEPLAPEWAAAARSHTGK